MLDGEWPSHPKTPGVDHRIVLDQRDLEGLQESWREVVRLVTQAKYALTGLSNPDHHVKATAHARRLLEEAGF